MEKEKARKLVYKVLLDEVGLKDADGIVPEADLKDDLGLDSLARLQIACDLDIDEDMQGLDTVQDLIDFVERYK